MYVDIPAATAKAGMYARGVFNLGSKEANTLPADAIVLRDGFSYAMQIVPLAVDANQPAPEGEESNNHLARIKQVKLETGRRSGNLVELFNVDGALNATFVASGGAFLADGDVVKVVGSIPESDESAAPAMQKGKFTDNKTLQKDPKPLSDHTANKAH